MSCGSIHSCRGLICARLMRVASSRFWMSLLSRSASSRTTPASDVSRSSLAITGDWLSTVAAPRIEASGVRNSWRDRADQRLAQQLGLGAHLGVVERARDVEPLERGGGIRQQRRRRRWRTSATASAGTLPRSMAITPKSGVLLRDAAHQPDVAGAVVHRGRRACEPALDLRDRRRARARGTASSSGLGSCRGRRPSEQHDLAPDEIGEVLLDREIDFGRRMAPPRAGAKTRRDRSSRSRACGRARSAASSSWRDGSSPRATTMNSTRLRISFGRAR